MQDNEKCELSNVEYNHPMSRRDLQGKKSHKRGMAGDKDAKSHAKVAKGRKDELGDIDDQVRTWRVPP
jgi:hypothetical protein